MQHPTRTALLALTLALGVAAPAVAQPPRHDARDARRDQRDDRRDLRELIRIRTQWERAIARRDLRARSIAERRLEEWLRDRVRSARRELREEQFDVRHATRRALRRERYEVEQARRDLESWEQALARVEGTRYGPYGRRARVDAWDLDFIEQLARAELREERRDVREARGYDAPRRWRRHRAPAPPPQPYGPPQDPAPYPYR